MLRCRAAEARVAMLDLELQRARELLRDKSFCLQVPNAVAVLPLPPIPRKRKASTLEVDISPEPLQGEQVGSGPRRDTLPSVTSFCLEWGMPFPTETFTAKMARLQKAPASVHFNDLNFFWLPVCFLHKCRRAIEKPDGICASLPVQVRSHALRRVTERYNDRMTTTVRHLQKLLTLVGLQGLRSILGVPKFDATAALKGAASRVVVTGRKTVELCTPSRILSFFDTEFRHQVSRL
jgi:hypothetical protein